MRDSEIIKLHKVQLNMALEVKRICEKHSINYFIIAGTLLGAVRHKGFIPWDDDMDLGMLREDYEKFVKVSEKELNKEYFLQSWDTDKHFGLPIIKIRKNNTLFIEKNSANIPMHQGIYIDIFPFDNVPNNSNKKKLQNIYTYIYKRLIFAKLGYILWTNENRIKKTIYYFIKIISKLYTIEKLKFLLEKEMKKYNNHKTNLVVTFGGAYGYKKETINRAWIDELEEIYFHNKAFMSFKKSEEYLRYFYGDYMTLPPMDKRENRHGIVKIEFGDDIN